MFRCAVCRENCWAKERVSSDSTACLIVIRAIQSPLRRFQLLVRCEDPLAEESKRLRTLLCVSGRA